MIVVPLVFASIIRGIASSGDVQFLKIMGMRMALYFIITTSLAILIGISVAMIINPGQYIDQNMLNSSLEQTAPAGIDQPLYGPNINNIPDFFVNLLPTNPLQAMVESQMLQVVIFAVIIGVALVSTESRNSKPLLELIESIQIVCMTVVRWAMVIAPFAVFGLLAQITIKVGVDALLGMVAYVGTVLLALLILLCMYCLIVFLTTRMSPLTFLKKFGLYSCWLSPPPAQLQ